jgi:hypothetical protein
MAEEKPPAAGAPPAGPPAAPPVPPAAPPATPDAFATFPTKEAFEERLERATRAKLRELGIDPAKAKADADELAGMKAAEEKRRAADMTEVEKAKAEVAKAEAAKVAAEVATKLAREEAEVAKLAAVHGVPDLEYLAFRLKGCIEGEDRSAWLKKLLEQPLERARFGIVESAPATPPAPGAKPATTSSTPAGGAPPAPPPKTGGTPEDNKGAMKMSKPEFENYKRSKYGSSSGGVRKGYTPPPR